MSEIDALKEDLAYLKLQLGIMIVTGISLIGWLSTAGLAGPVVLWLCGLVTLSIVGAGCYVLHIRIIRKIERIQELQIMEIITGLVMIGAGAFLTYLAIDATRDSKQTTQGLNTRESRRV